MLRVLEGTGTHHKVPDQTLKSVQHKHGCVDECKRHSTPVTYNRISILRAAAVPDEDGTRPIRMTATLGYSKGATTGS